jgi:predicted amidohydrolase YtcJ
MRAVARPTVPDTAVDTVLPGFLDAHVHLALVHLALTGAAAPAPATATATPTATPREALR